MSLIRGLGLLGICLALAEVPAWGSDPEGRPATGVPLSLTPTTDAEPFPSDAEVLPVQVPEVPATPRPRMPAIPPAPPRNARPPVAAAAPAAPRDITPPGTTSDFASATAPTTPAGEEGSGSQLGFNYTPIMIGDQAPLSLHALYTPVNVGPPPAPNPLHPPVPPSPSAAAHRLNIAVPWARGFKIADNQSPRPQDRVFFSTDYFNNLDKTINQHLSPGVGGMEAYRYLFGVEKTFWDGNASLGFRMPLDSLNVNSTLPGIGGSSTALGDMTVYSKLVLLQEQQTGNLLTGGLALTLPTGPISFAGAKGFGGFRDVQIQPFLGYIWSRGRFYVQGFEAIDVPTDPNDVTMQYNDVGIGYFIYRNRDPRAFLTAIAPTFETHLNIPLNHRGAYRANDPAGTPDVVDLTLGMNFVFHQSILTFGFVNPVTGPRPFDYECMLLFNYFFGRTRTLPFGPIPPVAGN